MARRFIFTFEPRAASSANSTFDSPKVAKIVKRCQELPGQELFEYVDPRGRIRGIGSGDVNEYLRRISGQDISAKDFRTWAGTFLAAKELQQVAKSESNARTKRQIKQAVEQVATVLGNTTTVCRKCYIHPEIIAAFLDHSLNKALLRHARRKTNGDLAGLTADESAVLALLEQRAKRSTNANTRRRSA